MLCIKKNICMHFQNLTLYLTSCFDNAYCLFVCLISSPEDVLKVTGFLLATLFVDNETEPSIWRSLGHYIRYQWKHVLFNKTEYGDNFQMITLSLVMFFILMLYVPVNNSSVMTEQVTVFLDWISTKQRIKCLAEGHDTVPRWVSSQRPFDRKI